MVFIATLKGRKVFYDLNSNVTSDKIFVCKYTDIFCMSFVCEVLKKNEGKVLLSV